VEGKNPASFNPRIFIFLTECARSAYGNHRGGKGKGRGKGRHLFSYASIGTDFCWLPGTPKGEGRGKEEGGRNTEVR